MDVNNKRLDRTRCHSVNGNASATWKFRTWDSKIEILPTYGHVVTGSFHERNPKSYQFIIQLMVTLPLFIHAGDIMLTKFQTENKHTWMNRQKDDASGTWWGRDITMRKPIQCSKILFIFYSVAPWHIMHICSNLGRKGMWRWMLQVLLLLLRTWKLTTRLLCVETKTHSVKAKYTQGRFQHLTSDI